MIKSDVVIIGAGVIGCALAECLSSRRPSLEIIVLEKESGPGRVTSRFNSGVIHTGLHLPSNTLKAKFAHHGGIEAIQYCKANKVPHRLCGMNIVVTSGELLHLWTQLGSFLQLNQRARQQGISCRVKTGWQIRNEMPNIKCLFGLNISEVHVVDPVSLVRSYYLKAKSRGVEFRFNETAVSFLSQHNKWDILSTNGLYRTKCVINASGIQSDIISEKAGFYPPKIYFYRGEYYEVVNEKRNLVNSLIYPVVRPGSPGLGIHLTKTFDGRLLLGPNARQVFREDQFDLERTKPDIFLESVNAFFPELLQEDIRWAFSGIRTKLSPGIAESDFIIKRENTSTPWYNLYGIESPGLSAARSIAKYLVDEIITMIR